jgi:dCTP deaminase
MTFLSDVDIRHLMTGEGVVNNQRIHIRPEPNERQLGQCSIDLTLSDQFARFRKFPLIRRTLDLKRREQVSDLQDRWFRHYTVTDNRGFVVHPNEVVLAQSNEYVRLPTSALGLLTGRSTYSRIGLEVQLTQDLKQPGHGARLLFQIKNNAPFSFRLYPHMRIAQLLIARLETPSSVAYDDDSDSKYAGDRNGITAHWPTDLELDNRPIVTGASYFRPFLDVLLIALGVLTVGAVIRTGVTTFRDPWVAVTAALTLTTLIARGYLYFRS